MSGLVYFVQEPRRRLSNSDVWVPLYDLEPARAFGELTFLLPPGPVPDFEEISSFLTTSQLVEFNPEKDVFAPVGPTPAVAFAAAFLARRFPFSSIQSLVWSSKKKRYFLEVL